MSRTNGRTHVVADDIRPYERGIERGDQLRGLVPDLLELYLRLFRSVGITESAVRDSAHRLADVIDGWDPRPLREIEGIAASAGIELWHAVALNGRTEILSQATVPTPGECSTLVHTPTSGSPFGIQTWDWHREVDPFWHTQRVVGTPHSYVGVTEAGILGKIGCNSAGLGLFFNILGHRDDAPAGVPVHVLAAQVLGEAGCVAEALDVLSSARSASSGALTLIDEHDAVCAEFSPAGLAELRSINGFLAHTNHFLDARNAEREKRELYEPDSQNRLALIDARTNSFPTPHTADDLLRYRCRVRASRPSAAYPIPQPHSGTAGRHWQPCGSSPDSAGIRVSDGSPADARTARELSAREELSVPS